MRDGFTQDKGKSNPSDNTASERGLLHSYISSNNSFLQALAAAISECSVSFKCLSLQNERNMSGEIIKDYKQHTASILPLIFLIYSGSIKRYSENLGTL